MAAFPQHLRKPEQRGKRTTDPQSLYLQKKGDYSTVLFYAFVQPTTAAVEAQAAYFKMQFFEPMYFKLMRASVGSSLTIDRRTGDLMLTAPRLSLAGLVSQAVISQLVDQAKGQALTLVLGAKWAGVFGLLTQLSDLKKRLDNQRLLTKNDAASKKKRFRERLKLIALLAGRSKGGNPVSWQITAVNNYDKYESAREEYLKFIHMDLKNRGIKIDNRAKIGPRR
jgi:hypothetical protein